MKHTILSFATAGLLISLSACDAHHGSTNDPRFQETSHGRAPETEPSAQGRTDFQKAMPVDTVGVDSLRDRSDKGMTDTPKP